MPLCELRGLTVAGRGSMLAQVSLLLPQSRTGTVLQVRLVDIHGDRYVDLHVALDDTAPGQAPQTGRVPASDCPGSLRPGDRVSVRFVMGVMTKVVRERAANDS